MTRTRFILNGGVKIGLPSGLGMAIIVTLNYVEQALENPLQSGFFLIWGGGLVLGFLAGCLIAGLLWNHVHSGLR